MWKFQYFSLTQILREINFEDSRNAKIAVFALLVSVDFVHLIKIRKIGAKIHENQISEPLNVLKWQILQV